MTGPAETHEIVLLAASSLRERYDVVDLLGLHIPSVPQALLAERVLLYVSVPDLFPLVSVASVCRVASCEMLVVFLHELPVLLAVLLAFLGKVRTAGVAAWPFGFNWHASSLPFLHEKTPEKIPPRLGKSMFDPFSLRT